MKQTFRPYRRLVKISGLSILFFSPIFSLPARARQPAPPAIDLVIIFDTSGSMRESVEGKVKLDVAKNVILKFIDQLPVHVNVGLLSFQEGCHVNLVRPLSAAEGNDRTDLKARVAGLSAGGQTPIGQALHVATTMLMNSSNRRRVVILTDGEETCDQQGLAVAADHAWQEKIKVYAVGFAMGQEPSENFRRIGIYKDATNNDGLSAVFAEIQKTLEKDPTQVDEGSRGGTDGPPVSFQGKDGSFRNGGNGRLYKTLQLESFYDRVFDSKTKFHVLEHGFHVVFNERDYTVRRVEVLRVRLAETGDPVYDGTEGFVYVTDAVIE